MRYFKIALAVLFVLCVSFFVVRGCIHKPAPSKHPLIRKVSGEKTPEMPPVTPAVPLPPARARMAIILDDWGYNFPLTKTAIALNCPITLSILPNLPYSGEIAEEAYTHHLGIMLHMPMQPYGKKQPLEKHTILLSTPDRDIVRFLDNALQSVQHAEGVNNHQGSAATSNERVMRTVLNHLKEKGLFFIDSDVTSSTVCPRISREIGIRFARRQVFIDNVPKVDAIKNKLSEAVRIALTSGKVVAIGHDKSVTLEAIRQMEPEFKQRGVKLVLAKELAER